MENVNYIDTNEFYVIVNKDCEDEFLDFIDLDGNPVFSDKVSDALKFYSNDEGELVIPKRFWLAHAKDVNHLAVLVNGYVVKVLEETEHRITYTRVD